MDDAPEGLTVPAALESMGRVFTDLIGGEVSALLMSAVRAGIIAACREPATIADVASASGRPERAVALTCEALAAVQVLEAEGDRYAVADAYRVLADPLSAVVASRFPPYADARIAAIRAAVEGDETYWSGAPEHRRAVADMVSPPPGTELGTGMIERRFDAVPEIRALLEAGGTWLELGCGVAGSLMTRMATMPQMRGVGVDLAEDLVAVARQRAEALGISDRLELVVGDATAYRHPQQVETTFWSQFFFPEPTREAALASARANTRPDGYVIAPLVVNDPMLAAAPGSPEAREAAMDRLVLRSWGVPIRTPDELAEEFTAAGLSDVRVMNRDGDPFIVARP